MQESALLVQNFEWAAVSVCPTQAAVLASYTQLHSYTAVFLVERGIATEASLYVTTFGSLCLKYWVNPTDCLTLQCGNIQSAVANAKPMHTLSAYPQHTRNPLCQPALCHIVTHPVTTLSVTYVCPNMVEQPLNLCHKFRLLLLQLLQPCSIMRFCLFPCQQH